MFSINMHSTVMTLRVFSHVFFKGAVKTQTYVGYHRKHIYIQWYYSAKRYTCISPLF